MRNGVCVLFVQHPFKNAPASALQSGSIVACARSFGNCDVATEVASRSRPVLVIRFKSLAFMRVCPKARRGLATGRRD